MYMYIGYASLSIGILSQQRDVGICRYFKDVLQLQLQLQLQRRAEAHTADAEAHHPSDSPDEVKIEFAHHPSVFVSYAIVLISGGIYAKHLPTSMPIKSSMRKARRNFAPLLRTPTARRSNRMIRASNRQPGPPKCRTPRSLLLHSELICYMYLIHHRIHHLSIILRPGPRRSSSERSSEGCI